jgi:flagellar hook assembly protein FlgD
VPSAGPTEIRFDLAVAGPATLQVFDVAGRRVRALVSEWRPAGRQWVRWDGRDEADRPVAPGVYFVELAGASGAGVARLVVIH